MLEEILADKRLEVEKRKAELGLEAVISRALASPAPRDFPAAVSRPGRLNLVAEIKYRSPSAGLIRREPPPAEVARIYEQAGASAISVLTDERHFGGRLESLAEARAASSLPILRKDFIVDEFQIYEARAAGADAVLLIVAALEQGRLEMLLETCRDAALPALVEVHSRDELARAAKAGATLIGINNRNLQTLQVDLQTTFDLLPHVPQGAIVVSESGISDRQTLERLKEAGVHAVLIGTAIMSSPDLLAAARSFILGSP